MIVVMISGMFAAFFGTRAYAQNTYNDILNSINGDSSEEKPPMKKTGSYGSYAVVADYDNCLTESEETELLEILHKAAQKAKCNVGVVITKDLEGKTDKNYSYAFSNEVFENGTNSVVLMLLNTYNKPEYSRYEDQIATDGAITNRFTDKERRTSFDKIYDKMGDPHGNQYAYNNTTKTYGGYDYFSSCKEFAKCVTRYSASGLAAVPMMFANYVTQNFSMFAGGLILAVIITLIVVKAKVNSYKKKATLSAANYIDRRATRVTRQVDQFIREYTTSHTHSSSSGSHGGGGHSGGHSSTGGRHR